MKESQAGRGAQDDLLQRVQMIEEMIAEGRRTTARHAWVFIWWGLICLAGVVWQEVLSAGLPWVWPMCLGVGVAGTVVAVVVQRRRVVAGRVRSLECRTVTIVWQVECIAMILYVGAAMYRNYTWQLSYTAGLLIMVGMAHAISAAILRWRAQAVVAALWWAGGVAIFFCTGRLSTVTIFAAEMLLGMLAFGIYALTLERRGSGGSGSMPEELPELDPVVHGKVRLAVLSLLAGVDEAEFTWLREKTGTTDGNLGAQMLKLEQAAYVEMEKRFLGRRPQTVYRLTPNGRAALAGYVAALKQLLGGALGA